VSDEWVVYHHYDGEDEAVIQGPGHNCRVMHHCAGDDCLICFMASKGYRLSYAGLWFMSYEPMAELLSMAAAVKWQRQNIGGEMANETG